MIDLKSYIGQLNKTKTKAELSNLKSASKIVEFTFQKIIDEVEEVLENGTKVTHASLQNKIEQLPENKPSMKELQDLMKDESFDTNCFDFYGPVQFQSGNEINVNRYSQSSDKNTLKPETIFANVAVKYKDMIAMACRSILVNPTKS
jgi:nucleosome binding factor SPN SPT16 subunit